MDSFLALLPEAFAEAIVGFVLHAAVSTTVVLMAAALADRFWKRASAADRHSLWLLCLIIGVLGPLFSTALTPPFATGPEASTPAMLAYDLPRQVSVSPTPTTLGSPAPDTSPLALTSPVRVPQEPVPAPTPPSITLGSRTFQGLALVALVGTAVLLMRALLGRLVLHRLHVSSRPLPDPDWQHLVDRVRREVGLRRPVRLRVHPTQPTPLTWGNCRPIVLLPEAARHWSESRREAVLLHELAHIRRWDCATQRLAEILRALVWFHPLTWWAVHRLHLDRELACDDLVLTTGTKPSDYAEHLVDLAQAASVRSIPGAIAMAHPHRLTHRVTAILDPHRTRRRSPVVLALVAGVLALASTAPRPVALAAEGSPIDAAPGSPTATSPLSPAVPPDQGIRILEDRMDQARRRVEQLDAELATLDSQIRSNVSSTPPTLRDSEPSDALESRIAQLQLDLKTRIVRDQSRLKSLRQLPVAILRNTLLSLYPEDRVLQHLGMLHATAAVDAEVAGSVYGPSHPENKAAHERIRILNQKLESAVEGILNALETQIEASRQELDSLDRESADARQRSSDLAAVYRTYYLKFRDRENARVMLDLLKRKLAQERFDSIFPRDSVISPPLNPPPP